MTVSLLSSLTLVIRRQSIACSFALAKSSEIPERLLLLCPLLLTIKTDNLVSILSRVAEGLGPEKPQQPVFPFSGETQVLTPTRSGRER
jgi:hypothetical protein